MTMGKRRALLRLGRAAVIASIACATLALASCGSHETPSSSFVPLSVVVAPKAAHFTPFFSFGGGKETNVNGGGGGLIVDANGNFYGVAQAGGDPTCITFYLNGPSGCGFVYELVRSGKTYKQIVLHTFYGPDGAAPKAGLVELNGSLFGTTSLGGRNRNPSCGYGAGCGTVFELTPSAAGYRFRVVHNFNGVDGAFPVAQLAADAQGNMYGTTQYGGGGFALCTTAIELIPGCGAVFKLTPSGSGFKETTIYRFTGKADGANPAQGVSIINGNLFGTTKYAYTIHRDCSLDPCGTIYELVPEKSGAYRFILIHTFMSGKNDGSTANALIAGPNGVLYGDTRVGGGGKCANVPGGQGKEGCGVIYTLTPAGGTYGFHIIHRFISHSEGIFPAFRLTLYKGKLYGSTGGGGIVNPSVPICVNLDGCGVLFSIDLSGAHYKVLYEFQGKKDGAWPLPPQVTYQGDIYGTTLVAGQYGYGSAFRYAP